MTTFEGTRTFAVESAGAPEQPSLIAGEHRPRASKADFADDVDVGKAVHLPSSILARSDW